MADCLFIYLSFSFPPFALCHAAEEDLAGNHQLHVQKGFQQIKAIVASSKVLSPSDETSSSNASLLICPLFLHNKD